MPSKVTSTGMVQVQYMSYSSSLIQALLFRKLLI